MARRLLFVCHANIVRSAAAELLSRAGVDAEGGWTFRSAGIGALVGRGIDEPIGRLLEGRGIDTSGHSAEQVSRGLVHEADLILTFEAAQRAWVLNEEPQARIKTLTVRRAARLLSRIPRRADPIAFLAADDAPYDASDDFEDPFGGGLPAAARALVELDGLLAVILPGIDATSRP